MSRDIESVALSLVASGKGILAADETVPTLTKRFDTLGIESTEQSRRSYREMLFTAGTADFISGVILQDETIRQKASDGTPLAQVLSKQGIVPGIKVDSGAKPLARVRAVPGDVALFAHGHVLRVLAARWIALPPTGGQHFLLDTGTVCVLGLYGDIPAVKTWNALAAP